MSKIENLDDLNKSSPTTMSLIDSGGQTIVRFQAKWPLRLGPGIFMTVWLTIWSIGCVVLTFAAFMQFNLFMFLFAIPFYIGWIAGSAMWVRCWFYREQLQLEFDRLQYSKHALVRLSSISIPYKELKNVGTAGADRSRVIKVESDVAEDILIGNSLSKKQIHVLKQIMDAVIPSLDGKPLTKSVAPELEDPQLQVRKRQPANCNWNRELAFGDKTAFSNQGKFKIGPVLSLLGITVFWCGIVSVFLVAPFIPMGAANGAGNGFGWLGLIFLYLFLTPFVVIGLLMIVMLVSSILEPFRKTIYEFSDREIARRLTYFGIPFVKTWPVMSRVEMRLLTSNDAEFLNDDPSTDISPGGKVGLQMENVLETDLDGFTIQFMEKETVIMKWEDLSKAEADWITTQLESEQDGYFVEV